MDEKYCKKYQELEENNWWFVNRRKIIELLIQREVSLQPGSSKAILNIGAAAGSTTRMLSRFGSVISVESNSDFAEVLRLQNIKTVEASVLALPFANESFDMVCAFDVVEHVEDDNMAFKEMRRVCKPGGLLFITVPAFQFLWSEHDKVNHHYRRYKKSDITKWAQAFKIKQRKVTYYNFFLFLPVLIARFFFRTSKSKGQSDFEHFAAPGWLHKIFDFIFSLERYFLKHINFPFGVSLYFAGEKLAND